MSVKLERRCLASAALATAAEASAEFAEGRYAARVLDRGCPHEVEASERLRFGYFVRQRKWVAEDPLCPGRERDGYDAFCHHMGVFRGPQLVAYLRALPWQAGRGFMLEREFRALLPAEAQRGLAQQGAVELTRLAVAPRGELARREVPFVSELLFRLFYREARRWDWKSLYVVVEDAWLPLFERRFKFRLEPLGRPHTFPDGTRTVAAQARLADLEAALAERRPQKLGWYQES